MRIRNRFLPKLYLDNRDSALLSFDKVMDRMFKDAFPGFAEELGIDFFDKASYPKVNVINNPDNIIIEAAVPGLELENISVKYDSKNNGLCIAGNSLPNTERDSAEPEYILRELKKSAFKRTFIVNYPERFNFEKIGASLKNGTLTITIPKSEADPIEKEITVKITN